MPWRTGNGTRSMIKNTWLSLSLGVQWVRRPVDLRHRETLHGQIAHQVRFGSYPTAVAVRPHRLPPARPDRRQRHGRQQAELPPVVPCRHPRVWVTMIDVSRSTSERRVTMWVMSGGSANSAADP